MEETPVTLPLPTSPLRKLKKKKKNRKDKTKTKPKATPPRYTVDGKLFFNSRAEMERFFSGKSRKTPSPKKKSKQQSNHNKTTPTSTPMKPTTATTLPLVSTPTSTPTTSPTRPPQTEHTLGGNFANLFFTKEDENKHNQEILQKAQQSRLKSDELYEKTKSKTSPQRFTTDQKLFFPSMGALRKYHYELEVGKLPGLLTEKELRQKAKLEKKKLKMQDRLRSAIPSWWTGMPMKEQTEYEACSLPPTPATTILSSSEDEEDLADRLEEEGIEREKEELTGRCLIICSFDPNTSCWHILTLQFSFFCLFY